MRTHYQDGMLLGDIASPTPGPDVLQHRRHVQATRYLKYTPVLRNTWLCEAI